MDKRHYFTQAVNINEIDTIFRTMTGKKVTGYSINSINSINETINLSLVTDDGYELNIIDLPTNEPNN